MKSPVDKTCSDCGRRPNPSIQSTDIADWWLTPIYEVSRNGRERVCTRLTMQCPECHKQRKNGKPGTATAGE